TMKWVIFGFTCTSAAFLVVVLGWVGLLARVPAWVVSIAPLLVITFPLSLAYATIRHRIVEVRGSQAW
ncbi:MAG: hypothetical protein M3007_07990, partial [Candidatus Eremiobacteraeota bacterium]|nr:hypothetical protein [Candidatus Eremiobacteraeota bacterium]